MRAYRQTLVGKQREQNVLKETNKFNSFLDKKCLYNIFHL
jgi:hypothetical protein